MAKVLELHFHAESGPAKVTIKDPKEPVDPVEVKEAMEKIVASNAFFSTNGDFISPKSARLIERYTQEIELYSE